MATITEAGSRSSITSGGSLPVLNVTAAVGDILALFIASDNNGAGGTSSISGVTDSAGNTWTNRGTVNRTSGGVPSDGTTHSQWTCNVTSPLTLGTVTVALSPNTTAKTASVWRIAPVSGEVISFLSAGAGGSNAGTSWSSGTIAAVPQYGILFASSATENNVASNADSDTTNGSWSARTSHSSDTGTSSTSQTITVQNKVVTAAGDQSYDSGTGTSSQYAFNWLIISSVFTEGTGSATGTGTGTGVGEADVQGVGSASGSASATGVGEGDVQGVGFATGTATAAAVGQADVEGVGTALGKAEGRGTAEYTLSGRKGGARILFRFDWVNGNISRLWLGDGVYSDGDANVWLGSALVDDGGLEELQQALNGEVGGFSFGLSGVSLETSGVVWQYYQDGNLVGSIVRVLIQACDQDMRPAGPLRTVFGGDINNVVFSRTATEKETLATVTVQASNKFLLRRSVSGGVMSDVDQRAYSALINPGADPDRFAERVTLMQNKKIVWPRFS